MALPVDVRADPDPFGERPDSDPIERIGVRRPPPLWRVKRLFVAFTMVLTGLALVVGTLAVVWWPGVIVVLGFGLAIAGAFFIRIDPSPPKRRE